MSVKKDFIKGTLILTFAGMAARCLGLFNRIYLANLLSAIELGRYQLIFPVFMFCMAITSSGLQIGVSKMVASFYGKNQILEVEYVLKTSLRWTIILSLICSSILYFRSGIICEIILKEPECKKYIEILAGVVPFASVHSCIGGYFYGCRKTAVPAAAQLLEQSVRLGSIYIIVKYLVTGEMADASAAIYAMAAGEMASCLVSYICYWLSINRMKKKIVKTGKYIERRSIAGQLWRYASVLTINRVSVSMLQSAEMILIPVMLGRYMGNQHKALELFGIITGIVMPILMFPNTISNALAVLLLPSVSEAEGQNNYDRIAKIFDKSMEYCMIMSIFASIFFAVYGRNVGSIFFGSEQAGIYIRSFSILCPLMYIQSLMASMLNGFGRVNETLMQHITASTIRIASILLLIPQIGIGGYLVGICLANLIISIWAIWRMKQLADVDFHIIRNVFMPSLAGIMSVNIAEIICRICINTWKISWTESIGFLIRCLLMVIVFMIWMLPVLSEDIRKEKVK